MLQTLTSKVTLITVIFMVLLGTAAMVTLASITSISRVTERVIEDNVKQIELSDRFMRQLTAANTDAQTLARVRTAVNHDDIEESLREAEATLSELQTILANEEHVVEAVDDNNYTHRLSQILAATQRQSADLIQAVEANNIPQVKKALVALEAMEKDIEGGLAQIDQVIQQQNAEAATTVATLIRRSVVSIAISFGLVLLLVLSAVFLVRRHVVQPILRLAHVSEVVANGDVGEQLTITSNDEIGLVQDSFNRMTTRLADHARHLQEQVVIAQAAQAEAEAARSLLEQQLQTIDEQHAIIREMSIPILPVTETTLVMPLIGALDTDRLRLVQEQALRAVEQAAARQLIVDVTGVPIIDTQVAQGLIQVVQAAGLLGAEVVLVGIQPEVAQTVVGAGIDLRGVRTRATVQSGIEYTSRETRRNQRRSKQG